MALVKKKVNDIGGRVLWLEVGACEMLSRGRVGVREVA